MIRSGSDGYVALLAVLIVGAAAMAIGLGLLAAGSDAQISNLASQRSIQARQLASGCVEESLQKIHDNTAFTGSGTLTLTTGNCTYVVTNTGTTTRTVTSTSTIGSVVRKVTAYVTINASSISITSWQDV